MLNIAQVLYKIVVVTPDGTQLDVTDVATALGFSEGEKELAAEIQFKLAASAEYNGKSVTELVKPFTPVFIYADMGAGYEEVARGTVQKWSIVESNREFYLEVETADECQALRHNEDDFFSQTGTAQAQSLKKFWASGASRMKSKSATVLTRKKFTAKNISAIWLPMC